MRPFLLAAALIVGFAAAALAVIALAPGSRPPPRTSAPTVEDAPAPTPPPVAPSPAAPVQPATLAPLPQPVAPPPPVVLGPPRREPPKGSWEAVPPVARASALGVGVGVAVSQALNELRPRLSACFDEVSQSRHGQDAVSGVRDDAPMDDNGVTVLMLELETRQDEVRIVDAPVEALGGASGGLLGCAQGVLRGKVIAAPGVKAGARHRMLFTLTQ